jgi:hypothetical protein
MAKEIKVSTTIMGTTIERFSIGRKICIRMKVQIKLKPAMPPNEIARPPK